MYLNVSLAADVHVDEGAEPNQTLPHFHTALSIRQIGNENTIKYPLARLIPNFLFVNLSSYAATLHALCYRSVIIFKCVLSI